MNNCEQSNFDYINKAKKYQQDAYDAAIVKATKCAENGKLSRVNKMTNDICKEAFDAFKSGLENIDPNHPDQDLIDLLLQTKEKVFFYDLKNQVLTILDHK